MHDAVEITHLLPKDWEQYKELRLKGLKEEPQAFGESLKSALSKTDKDWQDKLQQVLEGKSWLVFARVDGVLVGMLEADIHSDEPEKVWLHATWVNKESRRKGIAKKLMEKILQEISSSNAPRIVKLQVNQVQTPAVNLYKEFGFKIIAEEKFIAGNNELANDFLMEKHL